MSNQLTVRFSSDLARKLERTSKELRRKRSEIVRLALEVFLTETATIGTQPIDRVRDLLGRIESGIPDLGQRHREYLLKRLSRGR